MEEFKQAINRKKGVPMKKINNNLSQVFLAVFIALGFSSCAHHDNKVDHHHHEDTTKKISYEGKCAYSIEHGQYNVVGNPEFNVEHDGATYYFSSIEKMNDFKKDIAKHIQAANRNWEKNGRMK